MTVEVSLRAVELGDLHVFFAHEQDPEAQRRAHFRARDRQDFVEHWTRRILGDASVSVRTVLADGAIAGNVVSWWQDGRREVGYWLGQAFWDLSV